eukprot:gb/GECH01011752.1/.p1 GENE.gb/GECH01011752.1/~~gb/GECH01011752.1/.p1  ORF type:complete len:629 (+),score=187.31 gb/GECH01011752.1/:1-1887(+)
MISGPLQLVSIDSETQEAQINESSIRQLEQKVPSSELLHVFSIIGEYRGGKSTLLNHVLQREAFPTSNNELGCTAGILGVHLELERKQFIFLDTQGLGDAHGSEWFERIIYTLCLLLSSMFSLNFASGVLSRADLEKLKTVSEISNHIHLKSAPVDAEDDNSAPWTQIAPPLLLLFRNKAFRLSSSYAGYDDFLGEALKGNPLEHNCLSMMFVERYFRNIRDYQNDREGFNKDVNEFRKFLLNRMKPVSLKGVPITITTWIEELRVLVQALNSTSQDLCLELTWKQIEDNANKKILRQCEEKYNENMKRRITRFPIEEETLFHLHNQVSKEVTSSFHKNATGDFSEAQEMILTQLKVSSLEDEASTPLWITPWQKENRQRSVKLCNEVLDTLSEHLSRKMSNGEFLSKEGLNAYQQEMDHIEQEFHQVPEKGPEAIKVWQRFAHEKEKEFEIIVEQVENLSESEKKIALQEEQLRDERARSEEIREEKEDMQRKMDAEQTNMQNHFQAIQEMMQTMAKTQSENNSRLLDAVNRSYETSRAQNNEMMTTLFQKVSEDTNANRQKQMELAEKSQAQMQNMTAQLIEITRNKPERKNPLVETITTIGSMIHPAVGICKSLSDGYKALTRKE